MSGAARLLVVLPLVIAGGAWALLASDGGVPPLEEEALVSTPAKGKPSDTKATDAAPTLSTRTREKQDALLAGREAQTPVAWTPPPDMTQAMQAAQAAMAKDEFAKALGLLVPYLKKYPRWTEHLPTQEFVSALRAANAKNERERLAADFDDLVLRAARWGTLRPAENASTLEHRIRASAEIVGRFPAGPAREAVSRHVRRFAIGVPGRAELPVGFRGTNVDALIEAVAAREQVGPVESLPQDEAEETEARRLEELDRLRNAGALDVLDSVAGALAWLALHQGADGRFSDTAYHEVLTKRAEGTDTKVDAKGLQLHNSYELSTTALATLAFLDFRDQDLRGLFEPTLARAVQWLLKQQQPNGSFKSKGASRSFYSEAIAIMALGQAAATTKREDIKDAVKRGLTWMYTGVGDDGGYRYRSGQNGDLSASGWVVQAIETAGWAGVEIPQGMEDELRSFIRAVWVGGEKFSYLAGQRGASRLYPVGMLSMSILSPGDVSERLQKLWAKALARWPREDRLYQRYYHVRMAVKLEGKLSKALGELLLAYAKRQVAEGPLAGAFDVPARYMNLTGVTGRTAMTVLMFEHALYVR